MAAILPMQPKRSAMSSFFKDFDMLRTRTVVEVDIFYFMILLTISYIMPAKILDYEFYMCFCLLCDIAKVLIK